MRYFLCAVALCAVFFGIATPSQAVTTPTISCDAAQWLTQKHAKTSADCPALVALATQQILNNQIALNTSQVTASLHIPSGGLLIDDNAIPNAFVITNGSGQYQYSADPAISIIGTQPVSTQTNLTGGAVYTSAWVDANATGTRSLDVSVFSDQGGSYVIQTSDDNTDSGMTATMGCNGVSSACSSGVYTVTASALSTSGTIYVGHQYWRIVYTNGAGATAHFNLRVNAVNSTRSVLFASPQPVNIMNQVTANFGTSPLYSNQYQIAGTQIPSNYFQGIPGPYGIAPPTDVTYQGAILHCLYPTASPNPNPQPSPGNVTFVPCDAQGAPSFRIEGSGNYMPVDSNGNGRMRICDNSVNRCADVDTSNNLDVNCITGCSGSSMPTFVPPATPSPNPASTTVPVAALVRTGSNQFSLPVSCQNASVATVNDTTSGWSSLIAGVSAQATYICGVQVGNGTTAQQVGIGWGASNSCTSPTSAFQPQEPPYGGWVDHLIQANEVGALNAAFCVYAGGTTGVSYKVWYVQM